VPSKPKRSTPRILIFYQLADVYERLIRSRLPDADIVAIKDLDDEAAFRRHLPDAEILMSFAIPAQALLEAKSLRWIQAVSAGVDFLFPVRDHIKHVVVTNARGVHAEIIGDYVMGAMFMLQSGALRMFRNQLDKRWDRWARKPLAGLTLGIVGLGLIGQGVAARARASGMTVIGTRRSGAAVPGVEQVYSPGDIRAMLSRCDFVAVTLPGIKQTAGLFGGRELGAMKKGAYLINVSRGSVVDEPELIAALEEGRIAGACLDVFAAEPLPSGNPLWAMPNVIVTPHIAGLRDDTPELVTEIFLDNLKRYERGEPMRNRVDLDQGY
jgi:phosphoglycerate dehydrogenase-like enzyme